MLSGLAYGGKRELAEHLMEIREVRDPFEAKEKADKDTA